jgi:hypothetical protein
MNYPTAPVRFSGGGCFFCMAKVPTLRDSSIYRMGCISLPMATAASEPRQGEHQVSQFRKRKPPFFSKLSEWELTCNPT